jgi:pimeloyl-ACP methyl ester carboxylesterase
MSSTVAEIDVLEHRITVPGGSLYAKSWIPASRPVRTPLILFHDSIGCVDMWRQFPLALARALERPVFAYDRLGYGRSSARDDLPSLGFVAKEADGPVAALKEQLKIGSFIALGHSVGGAMAVHAAVRFPKACQLIITEASQAFVEDKTRQAIAMAAEKFKNPDELKKLERFHGAKAAWVVRAWTETWLSPAFASWSLKDDVLPRVTCPLLALHGELDEYGSTDFPDSFANDISGPGRAIVIPQCGHVPHREQESVVVGLIRDFIDSNAIP